MMTMMIPLILALLFPLSLGFIFSLLSISSTTPWNDRELNSPFECGFSPSSKARLPFSLRFFLLAVLFLIFDIEIIILLPLPILSYTTPLYVFLLPTLSFLLILTMGLMHEWNEGSLDWSK